MLAVAALLSVVLAAAAPTGAAPVTPDGPLSFSAGQLDWYDENGVLIFPNSSFGQLEIEIPLTFPHARKITYLTVEGDASRGLALLVQNFPINPQTIGMADARQAVDFDITLLGFTPPERISFLLLHYTVTDRVRAGDPLLPDEGFITSVGMNTIERFSFGSKLEGPTLEDPGRPAGIQIGDRIKKKDVIQHTDVRGVQEEVNACLAGALARSIDWLVRRDGKSAQDVYNDLRALKVGSSGPGATTYEEDVKAKDTYLKSIDPTATTKILDLANRIGPIEGVPEETGTDLVEWLKRELPTEDVELHYDKHIITVTGYFKAGPFHYIKYRDDETQGDDAKGDTAEKTAQLRKRADGSYQFRELGTNDFFKVQAALSESIPKEKGK